MKYFEAVRSNFSQCEPMAMPKYTPAFDILNIFASIAVVILHVNGRFWQFTYEPYWILCNFLETAFYWAVPVFFMLTGANLIDYNERYSTRTYMKKRMEKTLLPFLFWSIVAIVYQLLVSGLGIYSGKFSIRKTIDIILNTRANTLYWFFIALFVVYLLIPVVSKIPKCERKKTFTYIILILIFLNAVLPFVCNCFDIAYNGMLSLGGGYILYALIGYCITRFPISRKNRLVIYVMGFLGWALHFFGTWFLSYKSGWVNSAFKGYLNFPCIMMAVAVFVFFYYRKTNNQSQKKTKAIRNISSSSFGVYLVHYFVIQLFVGVIGVNTASELWIIFGTIPVYFISLIITIIAQKIPIIKKIIP